MAKSVLAYHKTVLRPSITSLVIPDEDKLVQASLFPATIWALPEEGGYADDPPKGPTWQLPDEAEIASPI